MSDLDTARASADDTAPIKVDDRAETTERRRRPIIPHTIRILAVPIILAWVAVTVLVNVLVPTLEVVGEAHSAPMTPLDAPSMVAMMRLGHNFREFDSNSTVMIVLEGQQPLGADAHRYYDTLIHQLEQDRKHIQHIQNFWGDRLTAAGAQSADAKGAYVMLNVAGNQGTTLANDSVDAVRKVLDHTQAPPGVKAYVTGPAALSDDMHLIGNASLATITLFTLGAIALMLLLVYRSIVTTLVQLFMTFVALASARGVVAVLGYNNAFGLTTFAANILTMLAIAAGTDYGIFLVGRYQEALRAGEDRESAFYTTFRGVAPVVLGSGLTIAGATYCLSFTRLPWFNTMGAPVAIGMLVVVLAGLTLGPAVVFLGSRFHLFESKRAARQGRLWRRVGTAVVRWPAPILAVSGAVVLVGMVALPSFKTSYNDRYYLPTSAPSNLGQAAADRHFSQARMNPDMLMVEADHDMRNPADMLVLDRVAKNVMRTVGIAMVQDITRPLGIPIQHSSIPFQNSVQSQTTMQNMQFLKDRMADMLKMADQMQFMIETTERMYAVSQELAKAADESAKTTADTSAITDQLRNHIADFDDFFRPIRSYFYWDKHCFDIPVCWALRCPVRLVGRVRSVGRAVPHSLGRHHPHRGGHARHDGLDPAHDQHAEDHARPHADDVFHFLGDDQPNGGHEQHRDRHGAEFRPVEERRHVLPATRGVRQPGLPDGTANVFVARRKVGPLLHHPPGRSDDSGRDFASRVGTDRRAGGPQAVIVVRRQGVPRRHGSDLQGHGRRGEVRPDDRRGVGVDADLHDHAFAHPQRVAALVIAGTAASSIAASFGLSVLIWQDLFGIRIHWIVAALSVIILLAVGSDYNLLLVSRFREEIHAGLKTGIIRSMAGTGGVVTSAGLVFAFTMASMLGSDLTVLGQFGSTVCIGLLLDTLIVRTLLMPSIATLLGRWFWWPQVVHPRGDNASFKTRPAVARA